VPEVEPAPALPLARQLEVPLPAESSPTRRPVGTGVLSGRITDANHHPVSFANVVLLGERIGTMSAEDGSYRISQLPSGTYSVRVQAIGYDAETREGVMIAGDQRATLDVQMGSAKVVKSVESIEVRAEKRIDTKSSATRSITGSGQVLRGGPPNVRSLPVEGVTDALAIAPPALQAYPPVIPTTGGTHLPNDEAFDSMFFKNHGVNPFIATDEDPRSTFAVDVDQASYTLTRRYLELGELPPADAVRVEEFVNFFPQGYPRFEGDDFRILLDGAPSPFGPGYHLLRVGLKGREVPSKDRRPAQLTFVIDVSGSMDRENRLGLAKQALHLLVDELRTDDRVGIVVYGSEAHVVLEPVAIGDAFASARAIATDPDEPGGGQPEGAKSGRERIVQAIQRLLPSGSTNAEHGLRLGYEMARRNFRSRAINRIVLCSDGVANVGRTGPESILAQVRGDADRGIHLSTIGFGMGNYNDVLMEQLADRGDGNHYYVDDLDEARRVFVENLTGTLQTIAQDAKVQVEFDSTRVLRYRLLGFENRDVADRDFRNDKVDAGEIGAGHEVTALYEIKLAPRATKGTLATVRLRYARPDADAGGRPRVRELERRFDSGAMERRFEDASPRFRLDAAVAEFAELLRGSYWAREGKWSDVLAVARRAARDTREPAADEFVVLVEKAADLSEKATSGQR
jgi:Ca-activated chloride channel family protein